jgi:hypothetical protein
MFFGDAFRELASRGDAVWKKEKQQQQRRGGGGGEGSPPPGPPSWEGQELEAAIRGLADPWVERVGRARQPEPPRIDARQRDHYLDHPDQFPDVEIDVSGAAPGASSAERPQATRRARLNRTMLEQMFRLSDDLGVSEDAALALMVRVATSPPPPSSWAAPSSSPDDSTVSACKRLWEEEERLPLAALLRLVQCRLGSDEIVALTDPLLDRLLPRVMQGIRDHTARIRDLWQRQRERQRETAAPASPFSPSYHHQHASGASGLPSSAATAAAGAARFHARLHAAQRQILCESVFYLAYHTQFKPDEVCQLLDLIKDLSDQVPVLDPLRDVPDPFRASADPGGDDYLRDPPYSPWATPGQYPHAHHPTAPTVVAKGELEWQKELVEAISETDLPNLLRCTSVLLASAVCALDATSDLVDRATHRIHAFGTVRHDKPPRGFDRPSVIASCCELNFSHASSFSMVLPFSPPFLPRKLYRSLIEIDRGTPCSLPIRTPRSTWPRFTAG